MKKLTGVLVAGLFVLALSFTSCNKDDDMKPIEPPTHLPEIEQPVHLPGSPVHLPEDGTTVDPA